MHQFTQHWTWRPDWTSQRRCWWWYATFEHDVEVHRLVEQVRSRLVPGAPVDVVPTRWLHLSLLEAGYPEVNTRASMYASARRAAHLLRDSPPLTTQVGPVDNTVGAVVLRVQLTPALRNLHRALTAASAELSTGIPMQRPFRPHVSVAYIRADCTPNEVLDHRPELSSRDIHSATVRTQLNRLTLAEVVRDPPHYRWTGRSILSLHEPDQRHRLPARR